MSCDQAILNFLFVKINRQLLLALALGHLSLTLNPSFSSTLNPFQFVNMFCAVWMLDMAIYACNHFSSAG